MKKNKEAPAFEKKQYFLGLTTGILSTILIFWLLPTATGRIKSGRINLPFIAKASPTPNASRLQKEIIQSVLPEKLDLGVSFGDVIIKMIRFGAIDKEKFKALYQNREGLSPDEARLLEQPSKEKIIVTQASSNLILNLLWPLGIANKAKVLSDGPMGTQYKNEVGNFASTGGWTLGKEGGGKLFNSLPLINLTSEQEKEVKEIAQNIYRPCCGNSTYFPDCNHGAAMLGFIELAVASGMPKEEIYQKALVLNSYWFPQTYAELAIYFQAKKGISWEKADPKEVLGPNFSSGGGYSAVNKELQTLGLLPKVQGGGGCGV